MFAQQKMEARIAPIIESSLMAARKGDSIRLDGALENIASRLPEIGASGGAKIHEVLSSHLAQATEIIENAVKRERATDTKPVDPTQLETARLHAKDSLFRTLAWAHNEAAELRTPLNTDLFVKAHMLLVCGHRGEQMLMGENLKLLETSFTLSKELQRFDYRAQKKVTAKLKELGVEKLLATGARRGKGISAQAVVDAVLDAYGLPRIPVEIDNSGRFTEREGSPRSLACFNPQRCTIHVNKKAAAIFENPKNAGEMLEVLLHEARHAVQFLLADNLLAFRADGTNPHCTHTKRHPATAKFPADLERFYLSFAAYTSHDSSRVSLYTPAYTGAIMRNNGLVERDANNFAENISGKLSPSSKLGIRRVGKDYLALLQTPEERPASALGKFGLADLPSSAFLNAHADREEDQGVASGQFKAVEGSLAYRTLALDPSNPATFERHANALRQQLKEPLLGSQTLRLASRNLQRHLEAIEGEKGYARERRIISSLRDLAIERLMAHDQSEPNYSGPELTKTGKLPRFPAPGNLTEVALFLDTYPGTENQRVLLWSLGEAKRLLGEGLTGIFHKKNLEEALERLRTTLDHKDDTKSHQILAEITAVRRLIRR